MPGIVYILINDAMPGLVKIGMTTTSLEQRMRELDNTSVPLPFKCYYAASVEKQDFIEGRLHVAFGDFRVRANREWFRIDPFRVKAALELVALVDVTPNTEVVTEAADTDALISNAARKGAFSFSDVDIPAGAVLTFARDPQYTVTVTGERTIEFEGQPSSLSKAALVCLNRMGVGWKSVAGPLFWLYEGETLNERRERLNNVEEGV